MHDNIRAAWNLAASSHKQGSTSRETQENFLNRFAEILIKKCSEISNTAEPYKSADLIKQHFGVEE